MCVGAHHGRKTIINDVEEFVKRTPYDHKSVTVILGGNDLSNGATTGQCIERYKTNVGFW